MDSKEAVRQKLELSEVVREVVSLSPTTQGKYKGLCPFHEEKTPSFHVDDNKGFYYCFGCHAQGDIFNFVMQTQGLEFSEALALLAKQAGVALRPASPQEQQQRDLYARNRWALEYFREQLQASSLARDYLAARKLSQESIDTFELGYAPEGWDNLLQHASSQGIAPPDLVEVGLLARSENGRFYDRFRHRIIFPIRDGMGRLVGFSGRVLDDSKPKYLNTPETAIFDKSQLLYGLFKAKPHIRKHHACIVTEGYMDVIALHQTGFTHAVAALGATLTKQQAGHLARADVRELYLAFDADEAGQRATLAGLEQSVGRQFYVRAVQMPLGKDPADVVLAGEIEAFEQALANGLPEVRYRFVQVLNQHDASSDAGKQAILHALEPAMQGHGVIDSTASELRRLVSDTLELEPKRLLDWLQAQASHKSRAKVNTLELRGMQSTPEGTRQQRIELELMVLLLREPTQLNEYLSWLETAVVDAPDSLLPAFCDCCRQYQGDVAKILHHYHQHEEGGNLIQRLFEEEARTHHDSDDDNDALLARDNALHIQKTLSLLRESYLEQQRQYQQQSLNDRFSYISQQLVDPHLSEETLQHYYHELREISALLAAREAERRSRLPSY